MSKFDKLASPDRDGEDYGYIHDYDVEVEIKDGMISTPCGEDVTYEPIKATVSLNAYTGYNWDGPYEDASSLYWEIESVVRSDGTELSDEDVNLNHDEILELADKEAIR